MKTPLNIKLRKYASHGIIFAYPDGSLIAEFETVSSNLIRILSADSIRNRVDIQILDTDLEIEELSKKEFQVSQSHPEDIAPENLMENERAIWHSRRLFLEGGRDMMVFETNFIQTKNKKIQIEYIARPAQYEAGKWILDLITKTLDSEKL